MKRITVQAPSGEFDFETPKDVILQFPKIPLHVVHAIAGYGGVYQYGPYRVSRRESYDSNL